MPTFIEFSRPDYATACPIAVEHIACFHPSLMHCNGHTTTHIELVNGNRIDVVGSYDDVKAKLVRAGVTFI